MEHNRKTIYKINDVEYHSLDEIPSNLKKFINPKLIETLRENKAKSYRDVVISPISEKSLEFKLMKWVLYVVGQVLSLVENQAMRSMAIIFNIVDVNIFLSLVFGFLIGQVGYSLAQRDFSKKSETINIKYSQSLTFLKSLKYHYWAPAILLF